MSSSFDKSLILSNGHLMPIDVKRIEVNRVDRLFVTATIVAAHLKVTCGN